MLLTGFELGREASVPYYLLTYEQFSLLYYTESYAPKTGSFEKSKQHISDSMYDDCKQ